MNNIENQNENLNDIIYEDINNEFAKGKYFDFEVIIMKSNGYINASKLCNNDNKRFTNWKENLNSRYLIAEIVSLTGIPEGSILINKNEIENNLKGIYVHNLLIPHIISWLSPKFAIKVSNIINNYAIYKFKKENEILKNNLEKINEKLNSTNNNIEDNKTAIYNFEGIENENIPRIYIIKLDDNTVSISRSSHYYYIIKRMLKFKKKYPNLNIDNDLKYIDISCNFDIFRRYIKNALSNYKTDYYSIFKINFDVCYELVKKVINDKIIDNVDNLIIS